MSDPRVSPLHEQHLAAGARMAEFGGWSMPLEYAGVLKEHAAVREAVGVFDVSHLGKATVIGPGAAALVDATLTNSLARIAPGRAQYTMCCDDATGGVVDDLIVYLRGDDDVFAVPNAANTAEVVRLLAAVAPDGVQVRDRHEDFALVAVQGPLADEVLLEVGLPHDLEYLGFVDIAWRGMPVTVCRTGYTGERGVEVVSRWQDAAAVWEAVLPAAQRLGGGACGLGSRDTLRTEMGYALHGHELSREITPVEAGLSWAVGWSKPAFWGRTALLGQKEAGAARGAWGLRCEGRGIPRPGMQVLSAQGQPCGTVTSGTFSPTLRTGIGLALLETVFAEGDRVSLDVRGRLSSARVVRPPFVDRSPR